MLKKYLKHFLKHSRFIHWLIVRTIYIYLKFVYLTSKWEFIWTDPALKNKFNTLDGALLALWHNRLAFAMHIFKKYDNVFALASSHTDGKIIIDVVRVMDYGVIEGSTNRNPTRAVRSIINLLELGNKIVITPDGPRGPVYKINSTITKIAYKYNKSLIPVSCMATKYFMVNSWDKMILPKPFGKIVVTIGKSIKLSGNVANDDSLLENELLNLSYKAETLL
ncbi:MAG: DUF374 domain-containing protein [Rickettsiaceae bacterium]|jgi:lysophospholipid acyltransferase (LPLAT)-like uncharacterized protein|nr:DUF374 domain-containing protein [Rickettsiaceae bacterium]